jgi:hypothetical protein
MNTIQLTYGEQERTAMILSDHETWTHCYQVEPKLGFRSYKHVGMGTIKVVPLTEDQFNLIPERIKNEHINGCR